MATINGTAGNDNLLGTSSADFIYGLGGDDYIDGGPGDDTLFGGEGNDTFVATHNIDTVDGGPGIDTAAFSTKRGENDIVRTTSGFTVYDINTATTYTGIERFRFSDKKVAFDLGPGEAAGNTVRVIGAAFGPQAIAQHPDWVGIGLGLFDAGQTLSQVCAMVAPLLALNATDFVTTVYRNVVGSAPDASTTASFVGMLQTGTTQAQLLELAASTDLIAARIDLVGLQDTGVTFS